MAAGQESNPKFHVGTGWVSLENWVSCLLIMNTLILMSIQGDVESSLKYRSNKRKKT